MAVRTYHGTCSSAAADVEKRVYVPDLDLAEEDFQFEEGDLLVVFFVNTNTESEPSIVVYNQDPDQELSTTSDSGKLIKSLDVEANIENAWAAGETVVFAYTQQGTSGIYYWELINAGHATVETYGDTKLFDEEDLNDLLEGTYVGEEDIALTPNTLKKFFDKLTSVFEPIEPGSEPTEESILGLRWTPIAGQELQLLGNLSLSSTSEGVDITYPIEQTMHDYIESQGLKVITHTGQLFNNGNGATDGNNPKTAEDAEPFITRIIPDNLYFGNGNGLYYDTPNPDSETISAFPRVILNDENDKMVLGGDAEDHTLGIVLNAPADVNGNLRADEIISTNTMTAGGEISTPSNVKGGTLYELYKNNYTPLSQIYNHKLKVFTESTPSYTLNKLSASGHSTSNQSKTLTVRTGYKPLCIVGYNINTDTSKGYYASYINLWEGYLYPTDNPTTLRYGFSNINMNKSQVAYVTFFILYEAI